MGGVTSKNVSFSNWYTNKCKRILVPTIFTNIVYLLLTYGTEIPSIDVLFRIFIYPNKSWFCGAILLYAIAYYSIAKGKKNRLFAAIAVSLLVYTWWYITKIDYTRVVVESMTYGGLCRTFYYFIVMLCGLGLYKLHISEIKMSTVGVFSCLVLGFICFAGSMLYKVVLNSYETQFIVQVFTLVSGLALFMGMSGLEDKLTRFYGKGFVNLISNYSWELYLVQTLVIPLCVNIVFPLNIVLVIALTVVGAFLLKKVCSIVMP